MSRKRIDDRPICNCESYCFPHRVGGKCSGYAFVNFYFNNIMALCSQCNCNNGQRCDVAEGQESIEHAECYEEARHYKPGERLPIKIEDIMPSEPEY